MVIKWTIETSRFVLEDPWIRVRADLCTGANGRVIDPYYVICSNDWVSILPLTPEGKVLVTEEYHHGGGVVAPGLPGGGIESGEDPSTAAERELLEETGYRPSELLTLGSAYANWGNQNNLVHYFVALGCERIGEQSLDANEEIDVRLERVEDILQPGFFKQSFHLANILLALPHLQRRDG
ncbi:NUDIX hydrolase [Arthrobacter sp. GMC3]|uniref:NUDIX hydrolase n=1 Tax=Arthrobacter sp. GMC3 TaxID=2058894 RepID=UPI000CE4D9D6|nr:NUDIX hydrolase [Arthrobacter sp. GMC3]